MTSLPGKTGYATDEAPWAELVICCVCWEVVYGKTFPDAIVGQEVVSEKEVSGYNFRSLMFRVGPRTHSRQ